MPVLGAGPNILLSVITPRLIAFWSAERLMVVLKQRDGDERLCVASNDQSLTLVLSDGVRSNPLESYVDY